MVPRALAHRRNRPLVRKSMPRWATSQPVLDVEHLEARELLNAGPTALNPDSAQFVTSLYNHLLDRSPASTEVAGWVTVLNAGASLHDVSQGFTNSIEYRIDVVTKDYQTFLGRMPSPMETQIWLSQMQAGFDEKQLQAAFL